MSERIYWDSFAEKFIIDRDAVAPPERYISVYCANGSIYTETWSVGDGKQLSIAYISDDWHENRAEQIRCDVASQHGVSLLRMIRWGVPKEHYDKIMQSLTGA